MRPIKLTLKAELDDGTIADVIIPFSVPEGMTLVDPRLCESSDTSHKTPAIVREGTAAGHRLDHVQKE
jgi:hypothetical protein